MIGQAIVLFEESYYHSGSAIPVSPDKIGLLGGGIVAVAEELASGANGGLHAESIGLGPNWSVGRLETVLTR